MSPPPKGYSHWSTSLLGKKFRLSNTTIHKILRANDLKPHQHRTFKVSKDPRFEEKALDVVMYEKSIDAFYALAGGRSGCVDGGVRSRRSKIDPDPPLPRSGHLSVVDVRGRAM